MKNTSLSFLLCSAAVLTMAPSSCEEDSGQDVGVNAQISECGGFAAASSDARTATLEGETCGDHILYWTYDAATASLTFTDHNVWLNCCGDHSIAIYHHNSEGYYEIAEIDAPEGEDGIRCKCMCFFDFQETLPELRPEPIVVELTLHVTDVTETPELVWEGTIDPGQGKGEIVIKQKVGYCN